MQLGLEGLRTLNQAALRPFFSFSLLCVPFPFLDLEWDSSVFDRQAQSRYPGESVQTWHSVCPLPTNSRNALLLSLSHSLLSFLVLEPSSHKHLWLGILFTFFGTTTFFLLLGNPLQHFLSSLPGWLGTFPETFGFYFLKSVFVCVCVCVLLCGQDWGLDPLEMELYLFLRQLMEVLGRKAWLFGRALSALSHWDHLSSPHASLFVWFLKQGLFLGSWLSWYSLYEPAWLQTHKDSSASAFWELGLKLSATCSLGSMLVFTVLFPVIPVLGFPSPCLRETCNKGGCCSPWVAKKDFWDSLDQGKLPDLGVGVLSQLIPLIELGWQANYPATLHHVRRCTLCGIVSFLINVINKFVEQGLIL